jgi:NADH-quinone oxidoreductase subunit F
MSRFEPVLLRNVGVAGSRRLDVYRSRGGYEAARKALTTMTDEQVAEEVKRSKLRGRGGAGFPTGVKWSFLPKDRDTTYLCVNFDESEPGTFNNRYVTDHDPHQLLEGILIAGYATRTTIAYIYIRGEFHETFHILQKALAGAYVCGEETGLLESLEGKRGWPRIKPPYPAVKGLFGKPTVINNVETICCVPHIIDRGEAWFRSIGTPSSSGPKLYTLSGPVNRPGCFEAPLGLTVRELIYGDDFGRGMIGDRKVKGVIPGGLSVGILSVDEIDCPMDFEELNKYGLLGLGTAGAIVINEDTDIRKVLLNMTRFYATESCGQCTQCREGTAWMYKMAKRIAEGAGRSEDLDILVETTRNMGMLPGMSICGHPDGAVYPIRTVIEKFRDEFEEHIRRQDPARVRQVLREINPAVYEVPIAVRQQVMSSE